MTKQRENTRLKSVKITNIKTGQEEVLSSFEKIHEKYGISKYALRKIASNKSKTDCEYIRVKETDTLYKVSMTFDYAVSARPENEDQEPISFTSAYKCIRFFGISMSTYYRRANESMIGIENPTPIKDRLGVKWYLTFLKELKDEFNNER